ncbi:cation:proton antiporter [Inmirania thermothiophila]|uniref:Kef-type potassium/proton antiporter (CPA2 family) n=1 Tax=Inmirania thermothiophila TaxID=1750597 RepID=A0A3N1Y4H6_9GAMM|nr:cation:proton antiporter [Inmirania thermothiophila]ROR32502.1 Kef-type potassium/proton antiporter (CPA2 family) [Inmirania thermothiophila]
MPESFVHLLPLFVLAALVVPVAVRLRLGAIVGFIAAGALAGPLGFGWVTRSEEIAAFAELGVVALLFLIGLDLRPERLWAMRGHVFGLGSAQVLLTGGVIAGASVAAGVAWPAAAVVGAALALSSTAFVAQILREDGVLGLPFGQAVLGVLLAQDLAVVPLVALAPMLGAGAAPDEGGTWWAAALEASAALGAVVLAGRYVANPLLRLATSHGGTELLPLLGVLITAGSAHLTEAAGLSAALGAFLAGVLLAESEFRHQLVAEIQPYRSLLLGLFFMGVGLSFEREVLLRHGGVVLAATGALVAVKAVLLTPLMRAAGLSWREAAGGALLLGQGGEFGLVLATVAMEAGVMEPALAQGLAMVVASSMVVTPFLAAAARRLRRALEGVAEVPPAEMAAGGRVVVAGFGRVGALTAEALQEGGVPWVGLDRRSGRVREARRGGLPVYFGDAARPEVLRAVGAASAPAIVLTMDRPDDVEAALAVIRQRCPGVPVVVRAYDARWGRVLAARGADAVVSEVLEVGLELAAEALVRAGVERSEADRRVNRVRRRHQPRA